MRVRWLGHPHSGVCPLTPGREYVVQSETADTVTIPGDGGPGLLDSCSREVKKWEVERVPLTPYEEFQQEAGQLVEAIGSVEPDEAFDFEALRLRLRELIHALGRKSVYEVTMTEAGEAAAREEGESWRDWRTNEYWGRRP